ncbi:hypothetical protein A1O3_00031 [Capronia epimyces CBS 606.96]|uniref:Transcription factor domain-containing protein n=1 Tax=Capronia epimyces CBS 606.96 TaxID=1182542 RepID=W9YG29_9EURO|nr:uncharacterized protein A1O3_00031 [Capronia epimyces CBS 606.96]EXJ91483.1 hypothetical protein A1O3_00031 [Capronia epimyces CBS 606.96]
MSIQPGPESPTLPKSHLTQSRGPFWNENDSAQDLASSGSLSTSTDQTWLQPQLPPQRDQDTGQNDLSLMQDPKPLDRTTIEDWDVGLLPTAEWNQNALFFSASAGASASASNLTSQTSMGSLPHDHDLGFADLDLEFTDAAILEPYLHHVDVLDPSTTEFLSIDHNPTLSAAHDGAYTFKSPLPWVADWSIEDHRNDSRYAEVVEQRVFNLPELSKIDILLQLYFSRAHHRLPVLNERYFFLLTQGQGHHGQAQDVSLPPISLALITFRNYPGNFYENERWTIKAYRLLETAGVLPNTNTNRSQGFVENPDWRRVSACWLHRFTSSFMGLKWTSSPELMEAVMFPWHQITLADFEEDFGFSWYLSAETKEQLTRIFVARISLQVTIGHLNKILWKQTVSEMSAIGGKPEIAAPQLTLTDSLPIEEIDVRLQRWKLENEDSLPMAASVYGACPEKRLLYAEHILTSMAYE